MSGSLAFQKDSTAESSFSLRKQASSKSLKNTASPMGGRPKGQTAATMKRSTTIGGQSPNSKSSKGSPGRGLTVRIDDDMPALRQSIQSAPVKVIRRLPAAPVPPVPALPLFIANPSGVPSASTSVCVTSVSTPAPPTPATAPATFGPIRTPRAVRPLPCPPACESSSSGSPSTPTPTANKLQHQAEVPTAVNFTHTRTTSITPTRVVRPLPIPKFNTPTRRNTSIDEPRSTCISPGIASPNSLQNYRSSTIDLTPKKKKETQNVLQKAIIAHGGESSEDEDVDEKESTDLDSLYGTLLTEGTIDSRLSSLLFSRNEDVDSSEETSPIGVHFRKGLTPHASFHHRPRRSVDSNRTVSSDSASEGDDHVIDDDVFLHEDDDDDDDELEDSEEGFIDYARILSSRVLYRKQQASYDPQFHSKWSLEKNGKRVTQQDISDVLRALRTL